MASLSTVPAYPAPNREAQVIFTLTQSGTNFVRAWLTQAPPGSELRKKLDASTQSRFPVHTGKGGAGDPWRFIFDKGGRYTLVVQEYAQGARDYGGGYQGSPDGAPSETKVGSESTLSLFIGQRMTSTIAAGGDSVDLVLWVWNDSIRATTKATHGEDSPALVKETPTARELAAIESAAVQTALDALVDELVADAVGSPEAIFGIAAGGFVKEWNDHVADSTAHEDADADNDLPVGLASSASVKGLRDAINAALPYIRNHYLNDAVNGGTVSGRDSGNYHNVSGKQNDNVNLPLIESAGSESDAYWALAELWRSHEAHRVSPVHDSADSTNVLTALPSLLEIARQVFTVWASTSPTVPTTQSTGAITLISKAGFEESPLET